MLTFLISDQLNVNDYVRLPVDDDDNGGDDDGDDDGVTQGHADIPDQLDANDGVRLPVDVGQCQGVAVIAKRSLLVT